MKTIKIYNMSTTGTPFHQNNFPWHIYVLSAIMWFWFKAYISISTAMQVHRKGFIRVFAFPAVASAASTANLFALWHFGVSSARYLVHAVTITMPTGNPLSWTWGQCHSLYSTSVGHTVTMALFGRKEKKKNKKQKKPVTSIAHRLEYLIVRASFRCTRSYDRLSTQFSVHTNSSYMYC